METCSEHSSLRNQPIVTSLLLSDHVNRTALFLLNNIHFLAKRYYSIRNNLKKTRDSIIKLGLLFFNQIKYVCLSFIEMYSNIPRRFALIVKCLGSFDDALDKQLSC
jgi:hypothetical protein